MNDYNNCFTCVHYYNEPNEFEVWCRITGKIIDNGYGEGCSNSCDIYKPVSSRYSKTIKSYTDSYLPF